MMGEVITFAKPKHIIFDGALYELVDPEVPTIYGNGIRLNGMNVDGLNAVECRTGEKNESKD